MVVLYTTAGDRVVALDSDTGKETLRYEFTTGTASQRGLAYWHGDRNNPPRIIFTSGLATVALIDPIWECGRSPELGGHDDRSSR
jgi:glucose dehydrogenase